MEFLKNKKLQIALLALLAGIAVFFSTYKLTESPSFWYDEGWYFQHAANLATGHIDGLQFAPGDIRHLAITTVGYPLIYTLALWMKVFGISVLSGRSLMVLFILGLCTAGFFLSKRLFGFSIALGSLALLVTFPPLYGNGKSVLGEVPGLLFLALSLLMLNFSLSDLGRKRLYLILSGLFLGLCLATKPIFLVFLPAFGVAILIELYRKNLTWKDIGVGLFFTALPLIVWVLVQFGVGDSLTHILGYYANPYYKTDLTATILGNIKGMLHDSSTLFTLFLLAVWSGSLLIKRHLKEKVSAAETAGYIFAVLIILAFLRSEGWLRYIFESQIVALIFFPSALGVVCNFFLPKVRINKTLIFSIGLIVLLSLANLYQLKYHSFVADAYPSHKTAFWQEYFTHISSSTSVLFDNTPEVVPFIQHRNYYQYISCAAGQFGTEELGLITSGAVRLIVMRTDGYNSSDKTFKLYTATSTAFKYTILQRKP